MRSAMRWWLASLAACLVAMGVGSGVRALAGEFDDVIVEKKDGDHAALVQALLDITNEGVDLYNSGDRAGCYRLYEGALKAAMPHLKHHAATEKAVKDGLAEAERQPQMAQRAYALRGVLDKVRGDLHGHKAETHKGPETKKPEDKKPETKPEIKKPETKPEIKKPEDKKPEDKKPETKPETKKPEDKKPEDKN